MKFFSLVLLLLAVSCGKEGGGQNVSQEKDMCSLNGRSVACESIHGTDGLGVDLLESMIDVPIQITNSEITFMADKASSSQGRRITCKTAVKSGEIYRFALRGNTLVLMTPGGSYSMARLTSGEGLIGTWAWKGYVDQGTHVIRQVTFLSKTRMIMRTTCEL
jgi:hypothetical protein